MVNFHRKKTVAKRDAFTSSIRPKCRCKYQVTTQVTECDSAFLILLHQLPQWSKSSFLFCRYAITSQTEVTEWITKIMRGEAVIDLTQQIIALHDIMYIDIENERENF